MKRKVKTLSFARGLETTGSEDGLELPAWAHFQNTRLDTGSAARRPGMQRILTAGNQASAFTFNGTDEYVAVTDYAQLTMGKVWTVEILFKPTDTTGEQTLFGFNHATDYPFRIFMDTSTLKAEVDFGDSAGPVTLTGGTVTAGATSHAMLVFRVDPDNKSQYEASLWTNRVQNTPTTGTSATLTPPGGIGMIATDNGGNYYAGVIDYVRILDVAKTDCRYWQMRLPDPKVSYVRLDMPMQVANVTTARVDDRSGHRNHGTAKGAPASATTLATQVSPVTHIGPRLDYSNESRLDVVAGGKIYLAEL